MAEAKSEDIRQLVLKMSLETLYIIFLFLCFSSLILSFLVVHSFFFLTGNCTTVGLILSLNWCPVYLKHYFYNVTFSWTVVIEAEFNYTQVLISSCYPLSFYILYTLSYMIFESIYVYYNKSCSKPQKFSLVFATNESIYVVRGFVYVTSEFVYVVRNQIFIFHLVASKKIFPFTNRNET